MFFQAGRHSSVPCLQQPDSDSGAWCFSRPRQTRVCVLVLLLQSSKLEGYDTRSWSTRTWSPAWIRTTTCKYYVHMISAADFAYVLRKRRKTRRMSCTKISFSNIFLSRTRGFTTPATKRRMTINWTAPAHGTRAHRQRRGRKKRSRYREDHQQKKGINKAFRSTRRVTPLEC